MNWKASLHEIFMQTFGQSLTVDEAYRCLLEQREDRMFSIASAQAESKRAQAKIVGAKQTLSVPVGTAGAAPKSMRRRSEAFILETNARFMIAQPCLDMARMELDFINRLITYVDVNALCRYANPFEGAQLVQAMESAYELAWAMLLDPNPHVVRNYLCHPHKDVIKRAVDAVENNLHDAHKIIVDQMAHDFALPRYTLSITVNVHDKDVMIQQSMDHMLPAYEASFNEGVSKLRVITNELPGIENTISSD